MKCLKCGREANHSLETKIAKRGIRYTFFHVTDDGVNELLVLECEWYVELEASEDLASLPKTDDVDDKPE